MTGVQTCALPIFSDILASESLPTWEAKRAEIYRLVDTYYLARADATNPMIVHDREHHH